MSAPAPPSQSLIPQPQLARENLTQPDGTPWVPPRVRVRDIVRGMIFWANVLPAEARGSEQNHAVPSPWLVISRDMIHRKMSIVHAAPLTSKLEKDRGDFRLFRIRVLDRDITRYTLGAGEAGLYPSDQLVLTEQARCLSHDRLIGNPIAKVTRQALAGVEAGIKYVLDMP